MSQAYTVCSKVNDGLLTNDLYDRNDYSARNRGDDGDTGGCWSFQESKLFLERWRRGRGRNLEGRYFEEQDLFQLTLAGETPWLSFMDILVHSDSRVGLFLKMTIDTE